MKKILISIAIIIALITAMFAYFQSNKEHYKFLDIPLNLKEDEFYEQLRMKGFKYDKESDEYSGRFGGEKCWILLHSTAITKTVYGVTVILENDITHSELEFNKYKSLFETYYGAAIVYKNNYPPEHPNNVDRITIPKQIDDLFGSYYRVFTSHGGIEDVHQFETNDDLGIIELFKIYREIKYENTYINLRRKTGDAICINYYDIKNLKKRDNEFELMRERYSIKDNTIHISEILNKQ